MTKSLSDLCVSAWPVESRIILETLLTDLKTRLLKIKKNG
jgi:hypothetical protein